MGVYQVGRGRRDLRPLVRLGCLAGGVIVERDLTGASGASPLDGLRDAKMKLANAIPWPSLDENFGDHMVRERVAPLLSLVGRAQETGHHGLGERETHRGLAP